MKLIIYVMIALLSGCHVTAHNNPFNDSLSTQQQPQYSQNLIIYFDAKTGAEPVLTAAKNIHASVIYRYHNFNALALKLPEKSSIEQGIRYFEKIDGVLQVTRDEIMQLH